MRKDFTWLVIGIALVLALGLVAQAEEKKDATKMAAAVSEEVLQLKLKVQQLEEALRVATIASAQCDAQFADARARLNSIQLTQEGERLKSGRGQLTELAKTSGFELVEVKGPDGRPTGQLELKKLASEATATPKDQAKK